MNVPICVMGVMRAFSFPVLSRPRSFSDLQTSVVISLKQNKDGNTFSTEDQVGITPSVVCVCICVFATAKTPHVKILK